MQSTKRQPAKRRRPAPSLGAINRQLGRMIDQVECLQAIIRDTMTAGGIGPHQATIRQLAQAGFRSRLFKLPPQVMEELCQQLADPLTATADALRWLKRQPGGRQIPRTTFYRFAHHFAAAQRQTPSRGIHRRR